MTIDPADCRRVYDDTELQLIASGRPADAKVRWTARWIAAGHPKSMLRRPN